MSEYRIARVNIEAIDDGMLVEPIYYKVFLVTQNGDNDEDGRVVYYEEAIWGE